jgi:YebC/PmpR family DNA-binding regulatory protein
MSGHSKWATIKHKKAALDAKRGKSFTRIIKEITIAARNGGDPDGNPRLRTAILAAKAVSMPADNIKKAIMRGTGELEGGMIEEVMFEGYGPGGAAVLVNVATDNRNRTAAELRSVLTKNGGSIATTGAVSRLFQRKGQIIIAREAANEDALMELALEAGAEDFKAESEGYEITTDPAGFEAVHKQIERKGVRCDAAEVTWLPVSTIHVTGSDASSVQKLIDSLEEHDDVKEVHTNAGFPDDTG